MGRSEENSSAERNAERNKVNCYNCKHFYITWDARLPRGCRRLGFKTRSLPSAEVFNSSGIPCLGFTLKPKAK